MDLEPNPDEPDPHFYQQRKLLTAAIALTALCAQLTTIMALPTDKEPRVSWNEDETKQFLQYLLDHRAEGGDGGNFKAATFNAAARHIASYRTSGPVKVGKNMKTKYNGLKTTFRAIITYRDTTSGSHWDNKNGANISGDAAESTWTNYLNASKANKAMQPFRNKGWKYFETFDEIIPNSSARGTHAFSPMNTGATGAPDELEEEDEEAGDAPGAAGSSGQDGGANNDAMEVDRDGDNSTLISAPTSKRKLTSDDDTITLNSGEPPTSSVNTSTTSFQSSKASSGPSKKKNTKSTSSISTSSRSQPKGASSRRSKASSSISSSSRAGGSRTSGRLSSDLLVHDMQGSINMLTSTVRDSMDTDPVTKVRQEAVRLLQTRDDGLSPDQKILLFHKFTNQHALTQTYLAIDDDQLRKVWLQQVCDN